MMCLNLAMNEISRLQPFLLTKKRLDTGMSLNEQLLFTTVTSRSGRFPRVCWSSSRSAELSGRGAQMTEDPPGTSR